MGSQRSILVVDCGVMLKGAIWGVGNNSFYQVNDVLS